MPLPLALIHTLEPVPGFEKEAFLKAHHEAPAVSVRIHTEKSTQLLAGAGTVPWCDRGRYLYERPVFTLDPLFHAGAYYVQEASSMFLDHVIRTLLPQRTGLRVLDLCAAPGGKSTLIASLLDKSSLLISNEVIRTRASILEENMVRWGYSNNWVTSNDPKEFEQLGGYFDLIVVDAPCSGSGLFRKDEKALDEWSEANVQLCSQRQRRILADIWKALKEDGFLVYATCSYSPQENEEVLDWLSENFPVSSADITVPEEWGIVRTISEKGLTGYRFFPDKVRGEGFFIAAVQKKETAKPFSYPRGKSQHDKKAAGQSSFLLNNSDDFVTLSTRENFAAVFRDHEPDFQLLNKTLFFRKTGVALGSPAHKEWLPAHDVALSLDRSVHLPFAEVDREQALKFLKKEEMNLSLQEKGWILITYQGMGLGWIKSLGSRSNNYLPKHWRIRMELPSDIG